MMSEHLRIRTSSKLTFKILGLANKQKTIVSPSQKSLVLTIEHPINDSQLSQKLKIGM